MIPSPIIIPESDYYNEEKKEKKEKQTFRINGKTYVDTGKKFPSSSFGDIYLVHEKDDETQQYILKSAKKFPTKEDTDKNFKMLEEEYDLLFAVDQCPHIIKVNGFLRDEDYAIMLSQYAEGGELFDYIKSVKYISLKTFNNLFRQLIIAVRCIHLLGVYNRDIKPENIVFLDREQTKLAIIDFGLAVKSDTDDCFQNVGTDDYKAVEVFNDSYRTFKCSKADIFALGKTLGYLFMLVRTTNPVYIKMKTLIMKMIQKDPEERISLDDAIKEYNRFSDTKIEAVNIKVKDEDFILVFKAKKSLRKIKSKQIKRKSKSLQKSKQIKRKSKSFKKSKQIKRKSLQKSK
jgi:serine/threonine protein kinase